MKQRFGAFLCMIFGSVLIMGGFSAGSDATGGGQVPTCQPNVVGVQVIPCPTGTIAITETTVPAGATPPAGGWKVVISSSNCTDTSGNPLDEATTVPLDADVIVSVPNGGTGTSDPLFVYTSPAHTTKCLYTLEEQPVAGFTAAFDPTSPVTLPFSEGPTNSGLKVALTNTFAAPTTTPTLTTSAPGSTSAAPSVTPTPGRPLANTGPREQVRLSFWIGIAVFALGVVLLLAGYRPRRGVHRSS